MWLLAMLGWTPGSPRKRESWKDRPVEVQPGVKKRLSSIVPRIHIAVGRWSRWGSSIVRLSEWPRRKGWQDGHRGRLKKLDRIGYCATQQRKMKAVLRYTIRRIRDNGVPYCAVLGSVRTTVGKWFALRRHLRISLEEEKRIQSICLRQSGGKNSWRHARSAKVWSKEVVGGKAYN